VDAGVFTARPSAQNGPASTGADLFMPAHADLTADPLLWQRLGDAVFAEENPLLGSAAMGWRTKLSTAVLLPLAGLAGLGLMTQKEAVDEEEEKLNRRQKPLGEPAR
jgi:hypothetical protein